MKNRHWFLVSAFVLIFSVSGKGFSAGTGAQAKPTETPRLTSREILKKLQLTDDQHKMLRHNRATFRHAMVLLDGQLKVKQVELETELEKPDPDQSKLDLIVGKIGELYGQRLSEKLKAKLEFERKILTPQQLDLLRTLQGQEGPDESL